MAATEQQTPTGYTTADFTDFAHTGPGTLAGRYLRRFWQPIHRAIDLPPGHAKPLRILGEDFTLYRGEDGTPHVVAPRCAHRGTQLSTGWVEGDCIRCFYHGWKYDGSGQCLEMPAEDPSFPPKVRIASYPTEEYLGLVFAYLGDGAAPPLPRYLDFERPGVLHATTYVRECNFFQNIENGLDPVHTAFAHRDPGAKFRGLIGVPRMEGEESPWGITMRGTRPNGLVRVNQYGMPNLLHLKLDLGDPEAGWHDVMAWRVPIDDERHCSFSANLIALSGDVGERYLEREAQRDAELATHPPAMELADAILRGELRIADVAEHPGLINIQDIVAQAGQGRLVDRAQDRLGRSDVLVILLRKIWGRELHALAEGRPLTAWTRPADLLAESGA
jgi:5,5'-dehydrodivanillate O-demethylase oxygenase subunit